VLLPSANEKAEHVAVCAAAAAAAAANRSTAYFLSLLFFSEFIPSKKWCAGQVLPKPVYYKSLQCIQTQ